MNKEKLSIYDYMPDVILEEESTKTESISKEQLAKFFKERVYQSTEYALLESLYRLPYLTKKNMERFADYRLKDKRYAGYDNTIRQLEKDGCLRRFVYDDVRLYRLHDEARAYFAEKLDAKDIHKIEIPSEHNAAAVLESASLAQWHLSVMLGGGTKKAYFGEEIILRKSKLLIPSYLEVEKEAIKYRLLSFAVPKVSLHMETFLGYIIKVKEALYKWELSFKRELFLLVLVCSDTDDMLQLATIIEGLNATHNLQVYFVADPNTAFSKGIDLLYVTEKQGNDLVLKTIRIKQ